MFTSFIHVQADREYHYIAWIVGLDRDGPGASEVDKRLIKRGINECRDSVHFLFGLLFIFGPQAFIRTDSNAKLLRFDAAQAISFHFIT